MVYVRPIGTAAQLEQRRRRAIELLKSGLAQRAVGRQLGVGSGTVPRWRKAYRRGGDSALKAKPHPGRPAKLSRRAFRRLPEVLKRGALAHGFSTDLWTQKRIATVIRRQFGVRYNFRYVWYLMRKLNWTCQKPRRSPIERNDEATGRWVQQDWPRIKKSPARR